MQNIQENKLTCPNLSLMQNFKLRSSAYFLIKYVINLIVLNKSRREKH